MKGGRAMHPFKKIALLMFQHFLDNFPLLDRSPEEWALYLWTKRN